MRDSENRTVPPLQTGTPAPSVGDLERDLDAMRDAQFLFVYVLRRKDGAPLDSDDRRYAGQTIPQEMNRRVISDAGRAIVVGSNFRIPPEIQTLLAERFVFEDRSPDVAAPAR